MVQTLGNGFIQTNNLIIQHGSPGEPHNGGGPMAVMHSSYDYNWADVNKNYYKHYSICQVTNQTIIDALDVPIAPHQINDTGI